MVDYSRWEGIADSDDDSDLSEDDEAEAQILGPGFDDDDDDSGEVCPPCAPAAAPAPAPPPPPLTIDRLQRVERLGEEILTEQQQVVDFDRRRNANREALAALRRLERQGAEAAASAKHWVCTGDFFVKTPHGSTRAMLEADQARLDREIDALRRGITAKTSELCTLDPSVADGSNIHEAFANLRDDG